MNVRRLLQYKLTFEFSAKSKMMTRLVLLPDVQEQIPTYFSRYDAVLFVWQV